MPDPKWSLPTRRPLPIILIRGFGGLDVEDEKQLAYQGFNDGTVYPQKRGENYIYEGLILRFMKSNWHYQDATNVVGYYEPGHGGRAQVAGRARRARSRLLQRDTRSSSTSAWPWTLMSERVQPDDLWQSLWVFRYYDLGDRAFELYGEALVRLIDFIRALVRRQAAGGERAEGQHHRPFDGRADRARGDPAHVPQAERRRPPIARSTRS